MKLERKKKEEQENLGYDDLFGPIEGLYKYFKI